MKIQIENYNGIRVTAEGLSDTISKTEVIDITERAYDMINLVCRHTTIENTCEKHAESSKEEVVETITQTVKEVSSTPLIRPRIPNNIIDTKDLSIKKAVTENALVRCPSCGQSHCLAVPSGNHIYMMRRDYDDDEFGIIAEFDSLTNQEFINMCCKPETNRKAYYFDLQSVPFKDDVDFAVNNETEIFCPVCCISNQFSKWKKAFDNPLEYFETEHICDACGGEKLEQIVKGTKIYQCDSCGLQSDYDEKE